MYTELQELAYVRHGVVVSREEYAANLHQGKLIKYAFFGQIGYKTEQYEWAIRHHNNIPFNKEATVLQLQGAK